MRFEFGAYAEARTEHVAATDRPANDMVIRQEISDRSERTILKLSGPVDIDHAGEVWERLRDSVQRYRSVLVDLTDVPHMDSAGLASLAEAYRRARNRGTAFALIGVNQQVLKMLRLAGLQRVLKLYPTVANALTSLARRDFDPDCAARSFSESLQFTANGSFLTGLPAEHKRVA